MWWVKSLFFFSTQYLATTDGSGSPRVERGAAPPVAYVVCPEPIASIAAQSKASGRVYVNLYVGAEPRTHSFDCCAIKAYYDHIAGGDFVATCSVKEGKSTLIELNLSVPTEEEAKNVCSRWEAESQNIYEYVVTHLFG